MKAITVQEKLLHADPSATVFVLVGGRYVRIDDIVLTGISAIYPPTTVCITGESYISEREHEARIAELMRHVAMEAE